MSRNNVLLVVRFRDRRGWYVFGPADADEEWNDEWVRDRVDRCRGAGMTWSAALRVAHALQRQWDTEYGVREMVVLP